MHRKINHLRCKILNSSKHSNLQLILFNFTKDNQHRINITMEQQPHIILRQALCSLHNIIRPSRTFLSQGNHKGIISNRPLTILNKHTMSHQSRLKLTQLCLNNPIQLATYHPSNPFRHSSQ